MLAMDVFSHDEDDFWRVDRESHAAFKITAAMISAGNAKNNQACRQRVSDTETDVLHRNTFAPGSML